MSLGQKEIGNRVRTFSVSMAGSASELMLYTIHFNLDLKSQGQHQLDVDARQALSEINEASFKRSLTHLKSKKLIVETEGTTTGFSLTEAGKLEMRRVAPYYREERPWDGKVYLVNYDLPVTKNSLRNAFRDFLKSIGCGMLQHSLWLTPYDPRTPLMDYINSNQLDKELVIVSRLDLEGEMYPYQIPGLIEISFKLSEINEKYKNFLKLADEGISRERKVFEFLKVLKSDPQAPYDLIPQDWAGYRAHEFFKELF